MDFKTSQKILSKARIGKYETACAGDKKKTIFYLGQPSDDVVSWAEKPDSILNLIDKMTP